MAMTNQNHEVTVEICIVENRKGKEHQSLSFKVGGYVPAEPAPEKEINVRFSGGCIIFEYKSVMTVVNAPFECLMVTVFTRSLPEIVLAERSLEEVGAELQRIFYHQGLDRADQANRFGVG